jgi:hypothetical protein
VIFSLYNKYRSFYCINYTLIVDTYKAIISEGFDIGYTTVCCAITDIARQAREAFIRQEYGPGQMAEFDWSITQDEYDKKATELKQRQYELTDRLKKITESDENYSITTIALLNLVSRAPELFESSKVEQKGS